MKQTAQIKQLLKKLDIIYIEQKNGDIEIAEEISTKKLLEILKKNHLLDKTSSAISFN